MKLAEFSEKELEEIKNRFPNLTDLKTSFLFVTYNRAPSPNFDLNPITWALKSLSPSQKHINEVLVVVDGSDDYTLKNLSWAKKILNINLRVIARKERKGCSYSRKEGIEELANEFFFMGDDDCLFRKDFVLGTLAYYNLILSRFHIDPAVIAQPVFDLDVNFVKTVKNSEIGKTDFDNTWFYHNFDCLPRHMTYTRIGKIKMASPIEIETFKGVALCRRKAILKAGNFLDLSMWPNDFSEHIELSIRLQKKSEKMYYIPDARISSTHLRFGTKNNILKKSIRNYVFDGLELTLGQMCDISNKNKKPTGCRTDGKSFLSAKIGSLLSFYLKLGEPLALRFCKMEFDNFVKHGKNFKTDQHLRLPDRSARFRLWREAVDKGIKVAELQTGKKFDNFQKVIDNSFIKSPKMNKKLEAVIFDFDGVLSSGRFYSGLTKSNPKAHSKIVKSIFNKNNQRIIKKWMRGKMTFEELHQTYSKKVGISVEILNRSLIDSVLKMRLNKNLIIFAQKMKFINVKTAILTDNMDVFDRIFVPYNNLASKFDYIFSSSAHKLLKLDKNAFLLKRLLKKIGGKPENVLLIDDSPKIGEYMKKFGGNFYLYKDYDTGYPKFDEWVRENFEI